jgi:hypothetical protein
LPLLEVLLVASLSVVVLSRLAPIASLSLLVLLCELRLVTACGALSTPGAPRLAAAAEPMTARHRTQPMTR